jgi:DNA-binding NarL/FixJ family response regulator
LRGTPLIEILVVDHHPVTRMGVAALIAAQRDLRVCGEAASVTEALAQVDALTPQLIILDLWLSDRSGLTLIHALAERPTRPPMLVFTIHDEKLFAERALRAGASGYVMKSEPPQTLITAIRDVLAGRLHVSDAMAQSLFRRLCSEGTPSPGRLIALTDREIEVFELIGRGLNTEGIAERLGVSVKTIDTYRVNIRTKLDLEDAAEVLRHAVAWSLFM